MDGRVKKTRKTLACFLPTVGIVFGWLVHTDSVWGTQLWPQEVEIWHRGQTGVCVNVCVCIQTNCLKGSGLSQEGA